jgi:hypothetical protein
MTAPQPDPRPVYPTEADALRRAAELRREGVITGLIHSDRGWMLRYDPAWSA